MSDNKLTSRQEKAVDWMMMRESSGPPCGGILACDTGFGKTYVVTGLMRRTELWPTLLVVQRTLVRQWTNVMARLGIRDVSVITSKSCASASLNRRIVIVSLGILTTCVRGVPQAPPELTDRLWGRVVVDEAQVMLNEHTLTHRVLCGLRAQPRWAVTATPVGNDTRLADGRALAKFVGVVLDPHEPNDPHALSLLRELMYVGDVDIDRTDGLPLRVVNVRLSADKELEASVCRETLSRFRGQTPAGDCMTNAKLKMELLMHCRMAASHPAVYFKALADKSGSSSRDQTYAQRSQEAADMGASASSKMEFVVKDVVDSNESCVIFCDWTEERRILEQALTHAGVQTRSFHGDMSFDEREDAVLEFHALDRGALVAQIDCAAYGLNLQHLASRIYIMSPQWNPMLEKQAIARVHRTGQTRPVTALRLVLDGSIDEMCLERQAKKIDRATEVMLNDSLRRMLLGSERQ